LGSVETNIEFNHAAFRHGVTEADIWSAIEKFIYDSPFPGYDNKHLLLGFDINGNLLEVVYNTIDEHTINVFHAMKCRKKYLALIGK
jgi:hypothetical protein